MTLCPIAIAVGCRKCPAFSFCPAKSVLGDQPAKPEAKEEESPPQRSKGGKRKA